MTVNNPNLEIANINAYVIFGEILSICSQDTLYSAKNNYDINQGP